MPRPNLFIIGAAKCGTTSLHAYLARHPDVFMSEPKEPGYFLPEVGYYPTELAWYLGLFEDAGDARWVGEASTHYSKIPVFPSVAGRVAEFSPDARIIYLMRDPVDRAVSHYWHNVRKHEEARPILEAVERDVQYRAFGDYAMQLRPWFETFGRDRVLTLVFEEMVDDPAATLDRVLRWLELSPLPGSVALERKNARPREMTRTRGRGLVDRFRHSAVWERLSPVVPGPVRRWAVNSLALEPARVEDEPVGEAVELLRPWARERIETLEELLERDFHVWATSRGEEL